MVTSKNLSRGDGINKKLRVKSALARTEHSQITFFNGKSGLDPQFYIMSISKSDFVKTFLLSYI